MLGPICPDLTLRGGQVDGHLQPKRDCATQTKARCLRKDRRLRRPSAKLVDEAVDAYRLRKQSDEQKLEVLMALIALDRRAGGQATALHRPSEWIPKMERSHCQKHGTNCKLRAPQVWLLSS